MKTKKFKAYMLMFTTILLVLNSCVNSKKLRYFTTVPETGSTDIIKAPNENLILQNDILYITLFSSDEETNKILNTTGNSQGFLVDDSGYIKLPLIGSLKAAGLKKEQLADTITHLLTVRKLIIDPIIMVRITNFKITVLGEVNNPGVITIPNEHVNITELIALAGDLTIYGNRANVLLIREKDGKRIYKRFDLNKIDLFNSDIYNLKNQDIIYIEPTKAKAQALDRTPQTVSIIISSLTFFISIYTLATR